MDETMVKRIEEQINRFYDVMKGSLRFRIEPWENHQSSRMRQDSMADSMVSAANLATDIEEHLVGLMVIQQHVNMLWDQAEASHLQEMARLSSQQYVSKEGKMAGLIAAENELYQTKRRVDACVEAGRRAAWRLEKLHEVASRAAGLATA